MQHPGLRRSPVGLGVVATDERNDGIGTPVHVERRAQRCRVGGHQRKTRVHRHARQRRRERFGQAGQRLGLRCRYRDRHLCKGAFAPAVGILQPPAGGIARQCGDPPLGLQRQPQRERPAHGVHARHANPQLRILRCTRTPARDERRHGAAFGQRRDQPGEPGVAHREVLRAVIEAGAQRATRGHPAARCAAFLENGDCGPARRQQPRARQPRQSRADHRNRLTHAFLHAVYGTTPGARASLVRC